VFRVCFVCLGNICRSPTAEGVLQHLINKRGLGDKLSVDSAGTADYHIGKRPDSRSIATAKARGFELPGVARQFTAADFDAFDLILVMDQSNKRNVLSLARNDSDRAKVKLFREFDPEIQALNQKTHEVSAEVPDPYYGGDEGFEDVFDICERSAEGLIAHLEARGWR